MELPGDFFVDSMCVALPQVTGLAGTRSCCHCSARGWWPVLGWVGSCHWWNWEPGEHRELQASRSTQGSRIRPRFLPRGDGSIPGGCRAPAQPSCASSRRSSSSAKQLHQRNFGRISLGLTLKCSSCASKPEIKPKRAA